MDTNWGHFEGICTIEILPPPAERKWWEWVFARRPELVSTSPFAYVDPRGKRWYVWPGDRNNGLSTPPLSWRLMPPFSWREIRAGVLHDRYCVTQTEPSWEVHRMIYEAARCDHSSPPRAWGMWAGARWFGPRF